MRLILLCPTGIVFPFLGRSWFIIFTHFRLFSYWLKLYPEVEFSSLMALHLFHYILLISHAWPHTSMNNMCYGPLTRYVNLRVAHASGTFSPPPISKETTSWRSRHASRHVRHARAVMHVRIANPRWRGKRSRFPAHTQPAILRIW